MNVMVDCSVKRHFRASLYVLSMFMPSAVVDTPRRRRCTSAFIVTQQRSLIFSGVLSFLYKSQNTSRRLQYMSFKTLYIYLHCL